MGTAVPKGFAGYFNISNATRYFSPPSPASTGGCCVLLFFLPQLCYEQVEGDFSQYMGQLQDKKHALTGEVLKYLGLQWVAPSAIPT